MEKESFKNILPALFLDLFKKTVSKDLTLPLPVIKQTTDIFVDKFCEDNVNVGNCVDFLILQLYTWKDWSRWKNRFALSWVFGNKAIERWGATKQGAKYYQDLWLKEHNLNRESIKSSIFDPKKEHPLRKFIYHESDEYTKGRFHNTDNGFKMCIMETLMWSPLSELCKRCIHIEKCKKELGERIPELLRLREESVK